ncbi:MAG: hypothetical protein JWO59_3427 [Chloroflexi bacterium]|nr:hypothetical protein [Chloroflexota bacterium]
MFRIILHALRTGRKTVPLAVLNAGVPAALKGRPHLDPALCTGSAECVAVCPSAAIVLEPVDDAERQEFRLDYGACVFCGRCAAVCESGALTLSKDFALSTLRRDDLVLRQIVPPSRHDGGRVP